MSELIHLTLASALKGLSNKEFSAVELTQAHIDQMAAQSSLNAFITETPEQALAQAKESDAAYAAGTAGRLQGAPIGMKDLYATKGVRTTAGSKILGNFVPQYESTVSQKLKDAGAVTLGKLSCDEFAMGSSNTTSAYGNVISPWKRTNGDTRDLVPGGSSGGSSCAVSARMCLAATGTDTGGSIRQPSAITGICGMKPTYGRCSRWGIVAYASSLDQAGAFGRTVEDVALMMEVMAGHDPKDSTSANIPVPPFTEAIKHTNLKGMRVGIPQEYVADGMDPAVTSLWKQGADWLKQAGAEIIEVSLPHTKYALPAYYVIAPAECSSNLARYDGMRFGLRVDGANLNDTYSKTRAAGFGNEVTRRILVGSYVLSAGYYDAYYIKAQRVRRLIYNDFVNAFEKCDVLLTPATPSAAFAIGENEDDPIKMYLNDVFTVTVNLAGVPGMVVPAGFSADGLPLGLQLIGKHWQEETVFRFAKVLEDAAQFKSLPNGLR